MFLRKVQWHEKERGGNGDKYNYTTSTSRPVKKKKKKKKTTELSDLKPPLDTDKLHATLSESNVTFKLCFKACIRQKIWKDHFDKTTLRQVIPYLSDLIFFFFFFLGGGGGVKSAVTLHLIKSLRVCLTSSVIGPFDFKANNFSTHLIWPSRNPTKCEHTVSKTETNIIIAVIQF